jgi:hypothetical protein
VQPANAALMAEDFYLTGRLLDGRDMRQWKFEELILERKGRTYNEWHVNFEEAGGAIPSSKWLTLSTGENDKGASVQHTNTIYRFISHWKLRQSYSDMLLICTTDISRGQLKS